MSVLDDVTGSGAIIAFFEGWPSFHDANLRSVALDGTTMSCIFEVMQWDATDVPPGTAYKIRRKGKVRFDLSDLQDVELVGFFRQNVVFSLEVSKEDGLFVLSWSASVGMTGTLKSTYLQTTLVAESETT